MGSFWGLEVKLLGTDVPDVKECFGHKDIHISCSQCAGSHAHEWVVVQVDNGDRFESTIRCEHCGGRACATLTDYQHGNPCVERRHHVGPHHFKDGSVLPVGK